MTRKSPRRGNSRKPREQYWDRVYRQWRDTPASGIRLGTAIGTHEQVYIDPRRLSTHMHVVGATNVGKSFFLEGIIKQLIVQGHGICLLDPHGDLYTAYFDSVPTSTPFNPSSIWRNGSFPLTWRTPLTFLVLILLPETPV